MRVFLGLEILLICFIWVNSVLAGNYNGTIDSVENFSGNKKPGEKIGGDVTVTNTGEFAKFQVIVTLEGPDGFETEIKSRKKTINSGRSYTFQRSRDNLYKKIENSWPEGNYDVKVELKCVSTAEIVDSEYYPDRFRVIKGGNAPPWLLRNAPSQSSLTIEKGKDVSFSVKIYDSDGDEECVKWYLNDELKHIGYDVSDHVTGWSHEFDSSGEVKAIGFDKAGNESAPITWDIHVETSNHPPKITTRDPDQPTIKVKKGKKYHFTISIRDEDGDLDRVEWYFRGRKEYTDPTISGSYDRSDWDYTFDKEGEVKAVVYDTEGLSDYTRWQVKLEQTEKGEIEFKMSVSLKTLIRRRRRRQKSMFQIRNF